uniref:Uncharacterized protein n=1 Tax=Plectus sambesii TaxID=2011161 RepID=A0A914WVZ9_9BILA
MISTLDRYQAICILFCIVRAFAPTSANSKQDELRWSDLMAGREHMKEINSLYTQHYLRAANGLLWVIGTEVYNEASDGTKRELKRCIASISVEDENPQKSEAKCVLEAFNMVDKEKAGVKWVGAFGVRRMKRHAKKQSRDESPNNIASIPDVLNSTGLSSDDRDALMELIMEASGARVQVEQTLRGVSGLADWQDVAQAMIEANLRMNASWTKLLASLTKVQKVELDIKGYSFASHEQIESMFFRDDSYYNGTWQNDIPLEEYKNYGDNDHRNLLRRMVGRMAGGSSTEFISAMRSWPKRMKQRVLSPFAFAGAVLTPSIFGYTILSPNIFSASVLSPVMFNLELLTPRAFVPVILGPRILSPRILGPRAFVPQILLANILSPAIVRPVLFSPFILTPLVLSPGILAPSALGGRVLSPALLNPAILSPGALNVEILSPSLLSRR